MVDRPRGTTHRNRLSRRQVDHSGPSTSLSWASRELADVALDLARHGS